MTRRPGHKQTVVTPDHPQFLQLLKKVTAAVPDPATGCWIWPYAIQYGYGRVAVRDEHGVKHMLMAHRVSFELFNHPIPEDHQVDHLCMNRACVNPEHLESITQQENIRRQREAKYGPFESRTCKRGHPLAEAYVSPSGRRQCRKCQMATDAARRQERAA